MVARRRSRRLLVLQQHRADAGRRPGAPRPEERRVRAFSFDKLGGAPRLALARQALRRRRREAASPFLHARRRERDQQADGEARAEGGGAAQAQAELHHARCFLGRSPKQPECPARSYMFRGRPMQRWLLAYEMATRKARFAINFFSWLVPCFR